MKSVKYAAAAMAMVVVAAPALAAELTASEAAAAIRSGKISSTALVKALIAKAKAGKSLNAFITLNEAGALKAAAAADAARKPDAKLGPLHGVPLAIKDNIHVAGLMNSAGTPALKGFTPEKNAPVIVRLVSAGAIILGKTNMHELAFGITSNNGAFGAVGNAYSPKRFAGGSSGGTGSAVASRMAPAGLGSDTGGSVRIPAAVNGIAGLRPTLYRYLQAGITPISHTRDTAGPMARTVAGLILLDRAIAGGGPVEAAAANGTRLGVPRGTFWANLGPETKRVAEAALEKLKAAGVTLLEADLPSVPELNNKVSFPVALYETPRDLSDYLKLYETGLTVQAVADKIASPDVKGVFMDPILGEKPMPKPAYDAAIKTFRPQLRQAYVEYFAAKKVDASNFPTVALVAAPIKGSDETVMLKGKKVPTFATYIRNTDPGSNAGIPGLTVPAGLSSDGMPVGLEIDGPAWTDRRLLAIGLTMESVLGRLLPPKR
jgi:Asp-tRNA(Asn)/Glu-tRNA(Gln) amidotransferase A subunit family amidase